MEIGALKSPEYLGEDRTNIVEALHIRTVESLISRTSDPQFLINLAERLNITPARLSEIVATANRKLIPGFISGESHPKVYRGAILPGEF